MGMIYPKLRQAGEAVKHKRVDRLYAQAGLQVKKRKKIPLAERHPLERPTGARATNTNNGNFTNCPHGGGRTPSSSHLYHSRV